MARIAYSCCGEGRGHSSRTLTVVEELCRRGHEVRVFASHVAYQVPDVLAAVDAVVAAGGSRFGEVVAMQTKDGRRITWVYATDPEGNIIELQAWS